jgi:hypothetical protein
MVFDETEFEINRNYIPDLFLGLNQLDKEKPINIAINMEKTPMVFVLFFRKILQGTDSEINIFYKEDTDVLKTSLKSYGMVYNNIDNFNFPLPDQND